MRQNTTPYVQGNLAYKLDAYESESSAPYLEVLEGGGKTTESCKAATLRILPDPSEKSRQENFLEDEEKLIEFPSNPPEMHRENVDTATTHASGHSLFLTRDPLGFVDGPNMYAYVKQNPWTFVDPDGLFRTKKRNKSRFRSQNIRSRSGNGGWRTRNRANNNWRSQNWNRVNRWRSTRPERSKWRSKQPDFVPFMANHGGYNKIVSEDMFEDMLKDIYGENIKFAEFIDAKMLQGWKGAGWVSKEAAMWFAGGALIGGVIKAGRVAAGTRGLWRLTAKGADKIRKHGRFGKFYRSKSDGLWWVKDTAGHGGSAYKVFKETKTGLRWISDANKHGDFITGKHKSKIGKFIPWKELF